MEFEFSMILYNSNPDVINKPVQAIFRAVNSTLNKHQRIAFDSLLKNAHDLHAKNPKQRIDLYSMPRSELLKDIGYQSRNTKYLRDLLKAMTTMQVEWDILKSDGDMAWASCTPMPIVSFDRNNVYYGYVEAIKPALMQSRIFAKKDLSILRRLDNGVSCGLYDHVNRYRDNPSKKTKNKHWKEWRADIYGPVKEGSYLDEYKEFKREKLAPAIEDINENSDLTITLIEERDSDSRITNLQFKVEVKPMFVLPPEEQEENEEWDEKLEELGLSDRERRKILKTYDSATIEAHYEYTIRRMEAKNQPPMRLPGKYFKVAIEGGFAKDTLKSVKGVDPAVLKEIEETFKASRSKEAAAMFGEMDTDSQESEIEAFNKEQTLAELKIPAAEGKRTKRIMAPFYAWLARKTWGEGSAHEILEFALLSGKVKLN